MMAKNRLNGLGGETLALALLTAGEQAHSFSAFMPSAFTAKNWVLEGSKDQVQARITMWRQGYRPAIAFGLGLGAVVSYIARSPLPLLFAAGSGVAMISLYERVLPKEDRLTLAEWPILLLAGEVKPSAANQAINGPMGL